MGGGKSDIQPTEDEKVAGENAVAEWNRFVENDIPVQDEAIARTIGLRRNEESGVYEIDPGGPLNSDGSIRTDGSVAEASNEAAYTSAMRRVDPNNAGSVDGINREGAYAGAMSSTSEQMGQQSAVVRGISNVAAMGRGEQTQALQSGSQLANIAQQEAIQSANSSMQRRQSNGAVVGQLAGAAVGVGMHNANSIDTSTPVIDTSNGMTGDGTAGRSSLLPQVY